MKVWWVLAWSEYYPGGGLHNVDSTWETKEEAEAEAVIVRARENDDYVQVWNISEMLGVDE
jgi:hypothetical protein